MRQGLIALLFVAANVFAQDMTKPMTLIASPSMEGPFAGTVVTVAPHKTFHVGFLLNRPSSYTLEQLLEEDVAKGNKTRVLHGGDVAPTKIFALARERGGDGAIAMQESLFILSNEASLAYLKKPDAARFFLGYVSWQPDELKDEIELGWWIVLPASPEIVFRTDYGTMWEDLLKKSVAPRVEAK